MSDVFEVDYEEEEFFFDPLGDAIYDESDGEEEIIPEPLNNPILYGRHVE